MLLRSKIDIGTFKIFQFFFDRSPEFVPIFAMHPGLEFKIANSALLVLFV